MTPLNARQQWASAHLAAAREHGDIPRYGDPDWHALPPADPRRWAAVIIAAECWAEDGDDIPSRLRRELADHAAANAEIDHETFLAVNDRIRRSANNASYAQLQHRRGELTTEQLIEWEQANNEFVAGLTDVRPPIPKATGRE